METMENNLPSATHQEKAKKMKKLRRWQIAISLMNFVPNSPGIKALTTNLIISFIAPVLQSAPTSTLLTM